MNISFSISPSSSTSTWRKWMSLLIMTASGFTALGYQIVWTQQCTLWLGHESAAVLAVISAFFGGLAVGSLLLSSRIEQSSYPIRWYAGCEIVIALWCLALFALMSPFSNWILQLTGVEPSPLWQWSVAFCGTFVLLLPATSAMGATLPAMERVTVQIRVQGRSIAALYAANTFGAVIGVLATAFFLLPKYGLTQTAAICIILNCLCAITALFVLPRDAKELKPAVLSASPELKGLITRLVLTGLLGIGYEVLVVRVLSQVTEGTVYTFAMLLAVYLVGSALGAAFYETRLERLSNREKLSNRLFCALAVACLIGIASLWVCDVIKGLILDVLGNSMTTAISVETILAILAFGLPTFVMGALFSHLSANANASGASFGQVLSANTLGAAAAPIIFGALIAPLIGSKLALLLVVAGYLALTTRQIWFSPTVLIPAGFVLAISIWASPLRFIDIPENGHIVSYKEGIMATVSVVEDSTGVARLRINNRQQEGSSSSIMVDSRQALLPILLHPSPHRALFLGLGTGMTASSAAEDASLQVDAVELLPDVIAASQYFRRTFTDGGVNPRLHLKEADARRFVSVTQQQYDVVVSDNFHPARSGSGALYTVEHFRAVQKRLTSEGLFCQWLPLHQLDLATLQSIVKSFITVYPGGWAILASNSLETPVIGLVAINKNTFFDLEKLRKRLTDIALPKNPAAFAIEDEFALIGSFIAGPKALSQFAGNASANTDDHPVVAYRAPSITYAPESLPRDRLITLLHELSINTTDMISETLDVNWNHRMAAYWQARNKYIEIGRNVRPLANVQDMLSQVREPLLSVLRISPDFRPAYDPLVRMATILENTDEIVARELLSELVTIQPNRTEAEIELRHLSGITP